MQILVAQPWKDYSLLDSGHGKRLEKFGEFTVVKPDPQALWMPHLSDKEWSKADALFDESKGKGSWVLHSRIPDAWQLRWNDLTFYAKLSPFKHTGVFPEQSVNWEWMREKIQNAESRIKNEKKEIKVLNLFAYTGIATLVCAAAGAQVTHVDASKPTVGWARENQSASGLENKPIRWILDDALKFVAREIKRGVRYDGIIMDPPVYGHGPNGETWDFAKSFPELLHLCRQVLSEQPLFVLINAYAVSSSSIMLENMLIDFAKDLGGKIESGELALQEAGNKRLLSTGIFGRWSL